MPLDPRDPADELLGRTVVEAGLVGARALDECRSEQRRLREAGQDVPLAQVLVRRGHLAPAQLRAILGDETVVAPSLPATIGRYAIQHFLGEGGMGSVFAAEDPELHRRVAIKVLSDSLSEAMRARFRREARVLARIHHPNVVSLFDAGDCEGQLYLVMELVDGRSLGSHVARRKPSISERVALLEKVARGVHAAHGHGVVHRDLKPGNVLVTREGEPKVVDFGLAHWLEGEGDLTRTGVAVGTPGYMAPEQVHLEPGGITPRTDVHALGILLYELLTGRRPFDGATVKETIFNVLGQDPEPPRKFAPGIPRELERIVLQALAKDPEARYESAEAFADDLRRWLERRPVLAVVPGVLRRRGPIVAGIAAAVALAGVAVAWAVVGSPDSEPEQAIPERDEARAQREAYRILEDARTSLDLAWRYHYAADADFEELLRRVQRAQARIEAALETAPGLPQAHYLLGRALETRGDGVAAEAAYRRAIELDPELRAARRRLGRVLLERAFVCDVQFSHHAGRSSARVVSLAREAAGEIERALGEGETEEDALEIEFARAMLAYAHCEFQETRAICAAATQRFRGAPGVEDFHWLGATAQLDRREAIREVEVALAARPVFPLALLTRGYFHHCLEEFDEALADYERALRFDPDLSAAWCNRGIIHHVRKEYDAAMIAYDRAIELDPHVHPAWHNRGRLRVLREEYREAAEDFGRAIRDELDPLESLLLRGFARFESGDPRGAVEDFERALAIAPPDWVSRAVAESYLEEARTRAAASPK